MVPPWISTHGTTGLNGNMTHKRNKKFLPPEKSQREYEAKIEELEDLIHGIEMYLIHHNERWMEIYNEDRHTDAGNSLKEHAQGRIAAYAELRTFLLEFEKDEI